MKSSRLLPLLLSLVLAPAAFAWGEKGHYIVNEAAALSLPTDMPHFFYRSFSRLTWLGYDPDRWRNAGESLEAVNPPEHFLDYEYVSHLELPNDRYRYVDLLYQSGTLRRHGITVSTPGFLPWRIAEICDRLTSSWRQWRSSRPGSAERTHIEANIIRDAGVLGHYVGDGSNPHHTTINYNGWVEENPEGFANDCETHERFERNFVSHALSTAEVTPRVSPSPTLRTDYFATALGHVRESNGQLRALYRLDRDKAFDLFRRPPAPAGVEFAAARLAVGAGMLRDLWWSTWKNSERPRRRADGPAPSP